MNGELVIVEPMPAERAVHWKPLHDAYYILASLQPAGGGRRQIFVRQRVLANVQHLLRASHGRPVGILVGRFYRCPITTVDYEVIECLIECSGANTDDLSRVIAEGLEATRLEEGARVLGWYCSAPTLGPKLSGSLAAVHWAHFQKPWQTTLVVTGGASASGGAFFLYDNDAARWFYAPFYELPGDRPVVDQAKPTCIAWPQYMTVEQTVLVHPDELITTPADSEPSPTLSPEDRSVAASTRVPDVEGHELPSSEPLPPLPPLPAGLGGLIPQLDLAADHRPRLTPDAHEEQATAPAPDSAAALPVERAADTIGGTPIEKASIPDERRQWFAALRKAIRRARNTQRTPRSTEVERFLEEARSVGFVVAESFSSVMPATRAEVLWVLVDRATGILLTIAASDTQVLDATFHYNLHTDDAGLLQTVFPEHCDVASQTIYVRETCLDSFASRFRRLRETPGLEHEWKVSPVIYFLTPGEWQFLTARPAHSEDGVQRIYALNQERIRALAEPIRQQFGLEASPSQ
ncbi:MAG: hypothetical protein K0S86_3912 [Geminicoccaceae bacterium]|nr:hypothetical protein [Geminicoccaceae bacterium]